MFDYFNGSMCIKNKSNLLVCLRQQVAFLSYNILLSLPHNKTGFPLSTM